MTTHLIKRYIKVLDDINLCHPNQICVNSGLHLATTGIALESPVVLNITTWMSLRVSKLFPVRTRPWHLRVIVYREYACSRIKVHVCSLVSSQRFYGTHKKLMIDLFTFTRIIIKYNHLVRNGSHLSVKNRYHTSMWGKKWAMKYLNKKKMIRLGPLIIIFLLNWVIAYSLSVQYQIVDAKLPQVTCKRSHQFCRSLELYQCWRWFQLMSQNYRLKQWSFKQFRFTLLL